ncbi:MAG: biopolymer transporter ExbD [Candidatus Methylacidiphilales bacterium]|nr:biopolymer transporter ExbD [Candidatus Methylacidiphilales bacterium]
MRRPSQRLDRGTLTELNITPLLDLCFVLLIIFMITAPTLEQSIDLSLPDSTEQKAPSKIESEAVLQVALRADGSIYIERNRVSLRELEQAMRDLLRRKPNAAVYLRADKKLEYQKLVDVLDLIKKTGIKLGIATTPEKR